MTIGSYRIALSLGLWAFSLPLSSINSQKSILYLWREVWAFSVAFNVLCCLEVGAGGREGRKVDELSTVVGGESSTY